MLKAANMLKNALKYPLTVSIYFRFCFLSRFRFRFCFCFCNCPFSRPLLGLESEESPFRMRHESEDVPCGVANSCDI